MDAKDIVQNTYLKVWEKYNSIELSKGKSYLFTAIGFRLKKIQRNEKV